MNKSLLKKSLLAVMALFAASTSTFAYNNVWVKAEAYPTGAGTVYVNWDSDPEVVKLFDDTSEFKRSVNAGASTAYIYTQVEEGYQLAGFARDNGDQRYDNDQDVQIKVHADGLFTAIYDPTQYGDAGSSSAAEAEANAALEDMENPTDHIFAVFTQGDVARPAVGQETYGWVYCNKLNNEPGDEITLDAYGDSDNSTGMVRYYKFDHWSDASGTPISTDRIIKVTVQGGEVYYANFVETTKNDRDIVNPHKETGIEQVKYGVNEQLNSGVYDLSGRCIANTFSTPLSSLRCAKGIYIHKGKKFIKK